MTNPADALHSPDRHMPATAPRAASEPEGTQTVGAVFRDHAAFVLRVLRRLGVRPSDVEDAAQEVFVVVHRKIGTYDGSSTLRTWLFGIASRVASDNRRKAHRRREELVESPDLGTEAPTQLEHASRREFRRHLDDALDQLDDAKRAVFILYDMEDVPMDEIALGLGCPVNTAYSRLREARLLLRRYFVEKVQGGAP